MPMEIPLPQGYTRSELNDNKVKVTFSKFLYLKLRCTIFAFKINRTRSSVG